MYLWTDGVYLKAGLEKEKAALDEREHNPVRRVIHNVHRIKLPLPRTPTPFYRHLLLTARGALTITRISPNLRPGEGPNLPLPTGIEMTRDA